jgi:hypothetical protein
LWDGTICLFLKNQYLIDGIDLNPEFISIAKRKNPEGNFYVADMTNFTLNKKYDVVMCLFSSIGYVQTLDNVVRTLGCFKEHLNDNGIILVEPWFTPEEWNDGRVDIITAELNDMKLCRMSHSQKLDKISIVRFDYLFGNQAGIEYFSEEHKLGLFTVDELKNAFHEAGLDVEYDDQGISGRGIYVARKCQRRNSFDPPEPE